MLHIKQNKKERSLEEQLYIAGWILMLLGILGGYFYFRVIIPNIPLFPCMMYKFLGVYCPGCGGTRAIEALLQGKILLSLWYHPLVLYVVIIGGGFMITQTLERLFGRIRGWRFHTWYLYGAVVITILNCIIKNILLFCFQITL